LLCIKVLINIMKKQIYALSLAVVTLVVSQAETKSADRPNAYADAIHKTSRMVSDPKVRALAGKHGLNVLNVRDVPWLFHTQLKKRDPRGCNPSLRIH
jgi:hypothetical protein